MRIFISYRRDDSRHITARIYDELCRAFGDESVFKDVDSIGLGEDFREWIRQAISSTDVVLVVIGQQWLSAANEGGRRLEQESDPVRFEVELALECGVRLIPLFVDAATMPDAAEFPPDLRKLPDHNGMPVRDDPDFHRDMERLIQKLGGVLPDERELIEKLDADIGHRLSILPVLADPIFTFTQLHTAKAAVTGTTEQHARVGKLGTFQPLFEEFAGKSFYSLVWQLSRVVTGEQLKSLAGPLNSAKRLPSYFDKLMLLVPVGEEDSKWQMDPRCLDEFRGVLDAFAIGRW